MINTFATTGAAAHSTMVTGLTNGGSYSFFVRCQDAAANANTNDFTIGFSVALPADATPPVRSNGLPTGTLPAGTTQTAISLTTNENATCRYTTVAGVAYGAMTNTFAPPAATAHSTTVTGLTNGGSYSFFIRCQDVAANRQHQRLHHRLLGGIGADRWPRGRLRLQRGQRVEHGRHLRQQPHRRDLRRHLDPQGRFGNALSFDGVNDWVTVNATALLNLPTG